MAREITPAQEAESLKQALQPLLLAEFEFEGSTERYWTGIGDLQFNGETFNGIGAMGKVAGVRETLDVRAAGVVFTLNGLDSALLALGLGANYQGRPCRLWLGTFNEAAQLVEDPTLVFAGRMDVMGDTDDGETGDLELSAENNLVDLRRPRAWRNTDQDQQQLYPGDVGFEFAAALQDKAIQWG